MTSTLTSKRRLSVRFGPTTVDLAVPLTARVADLLESGGFPPGSRIVDASGAALPDDDQVGEIVEDGAVLYVVDAVHTPSLTRVTATAPTRTATPPGSAPVRAPEPAASDTPGPTRAAAHVHVDPASAGARTRSAARRTARGRPGAPGAPVAAGGPGAGTAPGRGAPSGPPDATAGPAVDPGEPAGATGRRAVVPPTTRRAVPGPDAASGASGAPDAPGRGTLPRPPGPARGPVPLPPGRAPGRGAHAARHGAGPATGDTTTRSPGTDLAPARRPGPAVPPPPRVDPPPSGATGRAAAAGRGSHRSAGEDQDRPAAPRGGPASVALSPGSFGVPMALAAVSVLLVVLATTAGDLPTWSTWTAGAALVLSGVVAAIRPGGTPLERWGRVAGAVAGGAGGFVLAVSLGGALDVAAVAGLVAASAVAMLGRASAVRLGVFEPWITVVAVGSGALAIDAALAIALSWPTYVGPLLLAGVSPLVMRALPALSLDVDEEQLVDTERLSNTSWSARTGVRRRRRPLRQATVELITLRASGIVAAGIVAVGLLVTFGYGIAVLSTMPGSLARWALLAEGVLLLGGLGLAARTMRARFTKRVLRFTAAAVAIETGFYLTRRVGEAGEVVTVVLLVVLALGIVAVSVALDSGWRSLRLSRIADFVEGFCVVFALPAALLAADVIAVLRQAAS